MQKSIELWRKLTSGSTNRKIFGVAVTVALLTVLVKLVTVVKELVVAWRFGTEDTIDAFLIALVVPSFLINVIANSFNAALIPTYIQVREQEGTTAAQRLFSGTTVWSLGLLGITTVLIVITAPLYLPLIASGFSPEKLSLTFLLLCVMAPTVLLSGILTLWSAVLNAAERFVLAALSPTITPAICVIFLLMAESWGIFALAGGLVCGTMLEVILLGVVLKRQGISLLPRWYGFDAHISQVATQYTPMIAGAFLVCSAPIVDQAMAAMLVPGSVATLNYGNRVIGSLISLISTALSIAVIPYFSKMIACEDWVGVQRTLIYYLRLIFIVTIPLAVLFVIFSEFIIQILFQRGSFTAEDTYLVAQIQSFYAVQIPFYIANILVVRLVSSMRQNYILMRVSGYNLIINITLNYIFMYWLGLKGIALATSCFYVFSFFYLIFFVMKNLKEVTV